MAEAFDPYRKWLGIPPEERPANHYRLLGIAPFENDPEVISHAADRQMAHVRTFQSGVHSAESQKLLNELSGARVCLLDVEKKAAYDARLRTQMAFDAQAKEGVVGGPSFGYHVQGALQYFKLQAQRAWTRQVLLRQAWYRLGEELSRHPLAEPLANFEAELNRLPKAEEQIVISERSAAGRGMIEQLAAFWAWMRTRLGEVQQGLRRSEVLTRLGRTAYEELGEDAGPPQLVLPIRALQARMVSYREQLAQLAVVPPGDWLSPRRLIWIVLACLIGIWVFLKVLGWLLR